MRGLMGYRMRRIRIRVREKQGLWREGGIIKVLRGILWKEGGIIKVLRGICRMKRPIRG